MKVVVKLVFIAENAISGQIHFVIATAIESIIPIHSIHKKLLLNNGSNILASEFITFTDNNKKDFTSQVNWFDYDAFDDMLNQMHWIKDVRMNQGTNEATKLNIIDFKKFLNKTFDMHFNIEIDKNGDNPNDKNDNDQNDKNSDKKSNNKDNNNNDNNSNNNGSIGKSKFIGQFQHNFGNMNNKKNKKKSKQSAIMESMGARLREMVSAANTNDIHHHIKRPSIELPRVSSQKIPLFFSDNYGFSKYKFYNPIIKDFNIKIIGNFANVYRSGINPNKQNFARDFKSAVTRSPNGNASIFIEVSSLLIPVIVKL